MRSLAKPGASIPARLPPVKPTLRLLLLCLMAVLLPLRSALATSLPGSETPCHMAALVLAHDSAMDAEPGDAEMQAPCHHAAGSAAHSASHCDHCSACTLAPPLFGPPPALLTPTAATPLRYPPLLAPAPRHLAEGLDRPPRRA